MSESPAPALKEIFAAETYRQIAREMTAIDPAFDAARFLALYARPGDLSLPRFHTVSGVSSRGRDP